VSISGLNVRWLRYHPRAGLPNDSTDNLGSIKAGNSLPSERLYAETLKPEVHFSNIKESNFLSQKNILLVHQHYKGRLVLAV
jgi:hypothetical protein